MPSAGSSSKWPPAHSILLPGNTPVAGTVGGSEASFDLTMATGSGDTAQVQTLANSTFPPARAAKPTLGSIST